MWILGITNSFNLLDRMDGLSRGVGLITSVALAILFWGEGNDVLCRLCLLLAGTLAGLLLFNFHPPAS